MRIAKEFEKFEFPKKYDAFIFSGVWCISAASRCRPNILYLHTPLRAIYDLKDYFIKKSNPAVRVALRKFADYWEPKDKSYMNQFDIIAANSKNVKGRVLRFYGKELYERTTVVYTGIETGKYKYIKSGDFYLSASRLDPLKRINMIVRAFKKMPDRKLVIAGSGSEERKLKKLAEGCSNITFLGSVNDEKMLQLYATCKATIAANIDEDLGLIAIESHASGKPIVAIKDGGFLETVDRGNGVFFENEAGIPKAVERLERTKWNHRLIQKSAKKFDINVFSSKIGKILEKTVKDYKRKRYA